MENIILIEQYLAGTLSEGDLKGFENRLQTEPILQKEVEAYREVIQGIDTHGQAQFMEKVAQWEADIRKAPPVSSPSNVRNLRTVRNRYLAIAATVAVLLTLSWFLWPKSPTGSGLVAENISPAQAYEQYYSPFPDKISVRGHNDRLLSTAVALYNEKNYSEALVKFDSLLVDSPTDDRMALYKGICMLEMDNPVEAMSLFERVANGESEFVDEGDWYLALAELKHEHISAAKALFEKMATAPNHDHKADAKKILLQLE